MPPQHFSEHCCQVKRTSNLAGRNIDSRVDDCFSSIKLEMDVLLENVMKEKGNYSAICWGLFLTSLCNSHMSKLSHKECGKKMSCKQREISILSCCSEKRIETQLNYTCWPNVDVSRWSRLIMFLNSQIVYFYLFFCFIWPHYESLNHKVMQLWSLYFGR